MKPPVLENNIYYSGDCFKNKQHKNRNTHEDQGFFRGHFIQTIHLVLPDDSIFLAADRRVRTGPGWTGPISFTTLPTAVTM
jgi:hypothetical protein